MAELYLDAHGPLILHLRALTNEMILDRADLSSFIFSTLPHQTNYYFVSIKPENVTCTCLT